MRGFARGCEGIRGVVRDMCPKCSRNVRFYENVWRFVQALAGAEWHVSGSRARP